MRPQLIPDGLEVTVPEPLPLLVTETNGRVLKVAVTDFADVIDTTHEPEEFVHAPDHPVKILSRPGLAVNVTDVPELKFREQVLELPQEMPVGLDATEPDPTVVTVSKYGTAVKVAVTLTAAVIETMHEPVPEQSPPQPANSLPPIAVAINETVLSPSENRYEQVEPQLIPIGSDSTKPWPVPAFLTVTVTVSAALADSSGSRAVTAIAATNSEATLRNDTFQNDVLTLPSPVSLQRPHLAEAHQKYPHGLNQPGQRVIGFSEFESNGFDENGCKGLLQRMFSAQKGPWPSQRTNVVHLERLLHF